MRLEVPKRPRVSHTPMELADEVKFALTCTSNSNLPYIRRSSLFNLLTICGNHQHRHLLRDNGFTNQILATITTIELNDEPCNLAAVAIFYLLTGCDKDNYPLEKTENLNFIVKFLKPTSANLKRKPSDQSKAINVNKEVISTKIREILVNNKEESSLPREGICAKWMALLTIEKSCLPDISLQDLPYSGDGTRDFSEKIREHGVIDAVFIVARECHSFLEENDSASSFATIEILTISLRIMENFAFLGKRNQSHLLGLRGKMKQGTRSSLTELLISIVKILTKVSEGTPCSNKEKLKNGDDPFAFDESETPPSKWEETLYKQRNNDRNRNLAQKSGRIPNRENDDESRSLVIDCIISCVKVLMNLTNENPIGCQQIASCGGLETMSSLIDSHFPSLKGVIDQKLDLLALILGFLVNMVEKNEDNRSRLAACEGNTIPLLCSIFENVESSEKEEEKMILEGYAAILLGYLSTESKCIRGTIADRLPNNRLTCLVPVLERFVAFHLTLNIISTETEKALKELVESCRV